MAIAAPDTTSQSSPAAAVRRTRVAVAGATGYAGQELVRLLARHPSINSRLKFMHQFRQLHYLV